MRNNRLDALTDYPFQRLTALLEGLAPGAEPLAMSIGEPQHAPPALLAEALARAPASWGKYPPVAGTPEFRAAVGAWLGRRYALPADYLAPDRQVLPVAGTREALYMAATLCVPEDIGGEKPIVLVPNPFYQVYSGAALIAGAEVRFVDAAMGPPDYTRLPDEVLARVALAYLCSPANPQGGVANLDLLTRNLALARRFGFTLAIDECYGEIYDREPPPGGLEAARRLGGGLRNLLVFNSLSKRSSVPGLRSGFVAGDPELIAAFTRLRSYGGAVLPLPVLEASIALWGDEAHVVANRVLYRAKFDLAERFLGNRFGFARPPGGFFLWLEVGDGEAAAKALWQRAGLRVLPGAYLARPDERGVNPGQGRIRVALVHDPDTVARALESLARTLEEGY
jgi:N-succinyldiaminopimelate aminotransferase